MVLHRIQIWPYLPNYWRIEEWYQYLLVKANTTKVVCELKSGVSQKPFHKSSFALTERRRVNWLFYHLNFWSNSCRQGLIRLLW